MSKYIEIRDEGEMSVTGMTRVWAVRNLRTGERIGDVRWYGGFRRYVFYPASDDFRQMLFDEFCLEKIAAFMRQANATHSLMLEDRKRGMMGV